MRRRHTVPAQLAAGAACGALLLAGCSASDDGGGGGEFDPDEEITLEISWWGDDDRAALFDEVIGNFMAEYPNITVEQTPVGSPDDLFNRLATDYPEVSTTNAIVDGTLYGLPTGGNATAAFVNVDILEQAGIEVPDASWTWDDFIEIANTVGSAGLTNDQGQPIYGVDLRVQDIIGTYAGQETELGLYDWEGNLAVDADDIAGWYEKELELLDGGGLPDPTIVTANWALPPDQQLYTLGQAAITFGYSNLAGAYSGAGETLVLPPPSDTGSSGVALLPSAFWSINAQTEHPEAAAMLVSWFLNEPSSAELILDTRGVPFNPEMAEIVTPLLEGPSKGAAEYVELTLDSGTVAPPQPAGGANMNKYSQDAESEVLFDRMTPQEAAEDWVAKLSADLED